MMQRNVYGDTYNGTPLLITGGTLVGSRGFIREQSVYIESGIIRHIGPDSSLGSVVGRNADVIDAAGCTISPGFIDAHAHPLSFGTSLRSVDARYPSVSSISDLVRAIESKAAALEPGAWVRGRGFDYGKYPAGRMPTRWDIDPVSQRNPVAIVHSSGHFALVNSAALEKANIEDDAGDPRGGRFVRDESGRITGMLLDTAMQLVLPTAIDVGGHAPNHNTFPAPLHELVDDLEAGLNAFAAAGVTTVVDAQTTARDMPAYISARRAGRLPVRSVCMYLANHLDDLAALGINGPIGDARLSLGPIKIYSDGSLIGSTAYYDDHYVGEPCSHGHPFWSAEQLQTLVRSAHELGFQIGIHSQGDAAIELCLDAYEGVIESGSSADYRHRLEHCGSPTPRQLDRIKALGVIPISQPNFLYEFGDNFVANLGEQRARALTPLRTELDMGIPVALSSDAPVSSHRPLRNIQSAVSRVSMSGADLGADENISVFDAVRAYTHNAARSIFREERFGSLRPGAVADVVVLGGDLASIAPAEVADIDVRYTIVDGRVIYSSNV